MSSPNPQQYLDRTAVERLNELTDSSSVAFSVIDVNGTIISVTRGTESLLGISQHQLTGRNILSFIHTEEADHFRSLLADIAAKSDSHSIQHRVKHETGSWRWVETTMRRSVLDAAVIICETHDITANKLVTDSLQDSLDWLISVMDAFRDAVFIEENEHVAYINSAFVDLYGYESAGEIVGRHVTEFQAPEDSQRMLSYTRTRVEGKYAPQVYQFYGKKKDGSYLLLEASVSTVNIGQRKIIITVIHDLSDPTFL